MAFTSEEEARIQRIEKGLAEINLKVSNLASKRQLNHVITLLERQIKQVIDDTASLRSQINALKK